MPYGVVQRLKGLGHSLKELLAIPQQVAALRSESAALRSRLEALAEHGNPFLVNEEALSHRQRLITEIIAADASAQQAYKLIQSAISKLPDQVERAHAPLHEVRYLMTYVMTPSGPGTLVDVAASSIYAAPLAELKGWMIKPVPVLALDYEREKLPFPDESIDGVLICEVIEHFVLDPLHCIIEINRILKPNGFVVLTTPNAASWFGIYQALQQRHPSRWPVYAWNAPNSLNHIHAREYLTWEVKLLLEAGGFGDIALTTRDYGISAPYRPIPGFALTDRGETIFCRARKRGLPQKRSFTPLYLHNVAFRPADS